MPKCEFNELTFQQHAFGELLAVYNAAIVGLPQVIDPQRERDLGFDAMCRIRLGTARAKAFFLQFKTPQVITAPGDLACWNHLGGPHYQFKLHRDKRAKNNKLIPVYRQHNLLVRLRNRGLAAFYCAPCFHTNHDLDAFRKLSVVRQRSVWLNPAGMGSIWDTDPHHVSYSPTGTRWALHSELQPMPEPTSWSEAMSSTEAKTFDEKDLDRLRRELSEEVEVNFRESQNTSNRRAKPPRMPPEPPEGDTLALVQATAFLLREHFAATLVVIPHRRWGQSMRGEPYWRWRDEDIS